MDNLLFQLIVASASIQLLVAWLPQIALLKYKKNKVGETIKKHQLPGLSVIISARNEAENLALFLPQILDQDYPEFELIVVNDRSTDQSSSLLDSFASRYRNLSVIDAEPNERYPGKKNALSTGIQNAKHEYLVFTDADCKPATKDWLRCLGESFQRGNQVVLGFGLFEKENGLVNKLYRLESIRIALRYFTAAALFKPYMAVGRSLGYTKSLFSEIDGFSNHQHIKSGDDDLFVQAMPKKVKYDLSLEALTISRTPETLFGWLTQKKRHQSAGKQYSLKSLFFLAIIELSDLFSILGLFYLMAAAKFHSALILLFLVLLRYLFHMFSIIRIQRVMCYESVSRKEIFLEPFLSLMNPLFSVASQLLHSQEWNRKK